MCVECPHSQYCSSLCPEAELYVKQDHVPQRELTIGTPRMGKWPEKKQKSTFTKTERRILEQIIAGKRRYEICQILGITSHSLETHLSNIRKKAQEKLPTVEE